MLIAFDIDGTLVDDDKVLSEYTLNTLKLLKEKGHILVPCTGRNLDGVPDSLKELDLIDYAIVTNGTLVYDIHKNEILSRYYFTTEEFLKICDIFEAMDADIDYVSDGPYYSSKDSLDHLEDYSMDPKFYSYIRSNRIPVDNIREDVINNKRVVNRVNIAFKDLKYRTFILNHKKDYFFDITTSVAHNLELMPRGISKLTGLKILQDKLSLTDEDIIFFGDSLNDFEALNSNYHTVAMNNGLDEVKKVAKFTTSDNNNNNGVAKYLENLLLK